MAYIVMALYSRDLIAHALGAVANLGLDLGPSLRMLGAHGVEPRHALGGLYDKKKQY